MADKTMGGLDGADLPLMTGDLIPVSRGGSQTKKATIQDILNLIGAGSGDVVGPAGATADTLPRFNGTTGKLIKGSGVAIDDDDKISGYKAKKTANVSTSSYTFQASDTGRIIPFTYAGAIAAQFPNNLPEDWACTALVTASAGEITFSAASGASMYNRQGHTKSAGQWAFITLYCVTNSGGSSAIVVIGGDTKA